MKVTDYRRSTIGLILGTASNANALGGVSISSNTSPGSGSILVATSSNMFEWRDALSFGSNTNDVSSVGTMGSSPSNTRADHVHRGVHSITAAGSNAVYGDVNLVAGTGIGISTAGQSIRIDGTSSIAAGTYVLAAHGGDEVFQSHGNAGTSEVIHLALGNAHAATLNANCTFTFTGATSGVEDSFTLELTEDGTGGWTPTWPGTVVWAGGSAPAHDTTAGTVTIYVFRSRDGGVTWYGFQAGASGSSISIGSNSTDVTTSSGLGGATTYSPSTHFHKGVHSISHTSNTFYGDVTVQAGTNVGITVPTTGTLRFDVNSAGGGGGGGSGDYSGVPWSSGTSMPGSPAADDRVTRTDLGYDYFYDGTRWLTVQEFQTHLVLSDALQGTNNAPVIGAPIDQGASGAWITRLDGWTIQTGGASATNYVTYQLTSVAGNNGTTNVGSSFSTQNDTLGNTVAKNVTVGALVTAADIRWRLTGTKTLSPTGLYLDATVYYRLVGT